jgi:hypothetical protein
LWEVRLKVEVGQTKPKANVTRVTCYNFIHSCSLMITLKLNYYLLIV